MSLEAPSAHSSSHLAHGVAGQYGAADWPALREPEAAHVARLYPELGAPVRIAWRSPRPLSAAALIESPRERFFLKRHHRSVRNPAALTEEHRFIAHLRARGVPIPAVLANASGDTVTAVDDWVYEVHAPATGVDLYRDAMSWEPIVEPLHARSAGRMLARLHDASADYSAPQRSTHVLVARSEVLGADDPVAALRGQLPARPGLADYLRRHDWPRDLATACGSGQAAFHARVARQRPLWVHGDWHASNLCWSGTGADADVSAVLDFGLAALDFALFDLATAIELNAIAWLVLDAAAARMPIARALIDGYRDVRPLDADDIGLLADTLPRVHIDYALSEIEYYHAITRSDANADVAYGTFLSGHAAWFRRPAGRALLDGIRALA